MVQESTRGRLFFVADISGALLRAMLIPAWGVALPHLPGAVLVLWLVVGVLFVVHDVTLSSVYRRDRAQQKPPTIVNTTTIDGVPLNPEDAARIREIVDGARKSQESKEAEKDELEAKLLLQ